MKVDNNEDCHYGRFVRMSINALRFNFISMRDERHGTGFLEKGKEVCVRIRLNVPLRVLRNEDRMMHVICHRRCLTL